MNQNLNQNKNEESENVSENNDSAKFEVEEDKEFEPQAPRGSISNNPRDNKVLFILLAILLTAIIVGGGVWWLKEKEIKNIEKNQQVQNLKQDRSVVRKNNKEVKNINEVSNQQVFDDYFLIPELGVKFRINDEEFRKDLTYKFNQVDEENSQVGFYTKSLNNLNEWCESGSLGTLSKVTGDFMTDEKYSDSNKNVPWYLKRSGLEKIGAKQFDNFFIYFAGPQEVCTGDDKEALKILGEQRVKMSEYIKNIELINSESTDYVGWNTYKNEKYGFEFKYPKDWEFKEWLSNNSPYLLMNMTLRSPKSQKIIKQAKEDDNDKSGDAVYFQNDMIVQVASENFSEDLIKKVGETEIGGKKATEYHIGGYGSSYGLVVENNRYFIKLDFKKCDEKCINDKSALSEDLKKILLSFKFL